MASQPDWRARKVQASAAENADQAEYLAVSYGSSNLEAGVYDERVAEEMDQFDLPDPQTVTDWAERDAQYDTATSEIGVEIMRRASLLGDLYPFKKQGNTVIYEPSSTLAYEFCLAVSQAPSLSEGEYSRLPRAFERLSRDIIVCFLGWDAQGYRTGWPPDGDRPSRFKAVVEFLHRATDEWHWRPAPGMPSDPDVKAPKDEGLDFVVWKTMRDGRAGHLCLLGQCACGRDDWMKKSHDLDVRRLESWIQPLTVAPVRVFMTPHHIPNNADFARIGREAGLTLDRARITLLAEHTDNRDYVIESVKEPLADLVKLVISGFEVD